MRSDNDPICAGNLTEYLVMHGFHLFQSSLELKWRLGDGGDLQMLSTVHADILKRQDVLCLIKELVSMLFPLS
jgi:hypothetical protein